MISTSGKIYAFRFFQDLRPIYPLYALLFEDSGLSTAQISFLFAWWAAISLAAEVPAGVFGDKFDRRKLIAFGNALTVPAFALWFIEPSFWSFAAGFLLWGMGSAFESGTYEALVFDELKVNGKEADYAKVTGRAEGWALLGILLATLAAAAIAQDGYSEALWASIATTVIASAIAISFPKAPPAEELAEAHYFSILKEGFLAAIRSRRILAAMAIATLTSATFGALEEYDPLFVSDVGVDRSGVALVLAVLCVLTAAGAFVAHRFDANKRWAMPVGLAVAGLLLLVAAIMQNKPAIVPFALFFLVIKAAEVVAAARLQHAIDRPERATITSVNGFSVDIAAIVIYGVFALSPDRFFAFGLVGAFLIAAAGVNLREIVKK